MKTHFETIIESRPTFDTPHIEIGYHIPRRNTIYETTLYGMATDDKKKKIELLRESISKLETQRTMAKGNKFKLDSIDRLIKRFEHDIQTLKKL